MLSIILIAAAASLLFGVDLSKAKEAVALAASKVDAKKAAALLLIVLAFALLPRFGGQPDQPTPAPDAGPLSLRGAFVGASASEDAAIIGALCSELADEVEWDGMQTQPYLKTGIAIDDLRKAARLFRCRGISIGDRQPVARDTIATYFEKNVGEDGGALTPEQRAAWVTAFRDVGRAASDAAR